MTAPALDIGTLIEIDPLCMGGGGWPMIAGTGVPVIRVASLSVREGWSPQAIAEDWDLTLAQVHAALAYYHCHQDEIERQVREADEEYYRLAGEAAARGERCWTLA